MDTYIFIGIGIIFISHSIHSYIYYKYEEHSYEDNKRLRFLLAGLFILISSVVYLIKK